MFGTLNNNSNENADSLSLMFRTILTNNGHFYTTDNHDLLKHSIKNHSKGGIRTHDSATQKLKCVELTWAQSWLGKNTSNLLHAKSKKEEGGDILRSVGLDY